MMEYVAAKVVHNLHLHNLNRSAHHSSWVFSAAQGFYFKGELNTDVHAIVWNYATGWCIPNLAILVCACVDNMSLTSPACAICVQNKASLLKLPSAQHAASMSDAGL
eukprot:273836-Amphidinium_carterae.1